MSIYSRMDKLSYNTYNEVSYVNEKTNKMNQNT